MSVDVSGLSPSNQDYLKALFKLGEWHDDPVTVKMLAQHIGVRLSSASDAVRRLEKKGLVTHMPYGAIGLSTEGRAFALAMVRRHRLIETFLVESLHYRWDQVHAEAEQLEHCVSDFFLERIDAELGFPRRDPHGDPIPSAAGDYPADYAATPASEPGDLRKLSDLEPGEAGIVDRISDVDADLLRFFSENNLTIGAAVSVQDSQPYSGGMAVRVEGNQNEYAQNEDAAAFSLSSHAARAVWVRM